MRIAKWESRASSGPDVNITAKKLIPAGLLALVLLAGPAVAADHTGQHGSQHLFGGPPQFIHRPTASRTNVRAVSPEKEKVYREAVQQTISAEKSLTIQVGQPQILVFNRPPIRIQLPDDSVANVTTISETELSVLSGNVGSTVLNIWFEKEDGSGNEILSYRINSIPDPTQKAREDNVYKALEGQVNVLFPDSNISLHSVGDKVVVKGKATDLIEAARIISIIDSGAISPVGSNIPVQTNISFDLSNPQPGDLPQIREFLISGTGNVINMLEVPDEKQIMLRVTVAEVNRLAARSVGFNFMFTDNENDFEITNLTGGVLGSSNLPFSYVNDTNFQASLRALRGLNFAKSLAEPTLVTMNGEEASFSTGGSFPIPVVTGATSNGLQGVSFQDFGVDLVFTPYTINGESIRLNIDGSVSSRDDGGGGTVESTQIPGLESREFNTTVEIIEGQTLAIAGILQTEQRRQSENLPLLGDLPFIGNFFGNREATSSEQELIVLVTPEIVESLTYDQVPSLPGSDVYEPDDLEFYLYGRLESRATVDFRSPVQNDFDRLRWHRLEQKFLFGPAGYSQKGTIEF